MAKLLIAVQSDIMSTALAEALTQHEVHCCHTGTEALTLLEILQPDAVIMELSLPVLTGLSVLQESRYRPPVILALTNIVTDFVLEAAAAAGVQDLLIMPCTVDSILRHLSAHMGNPRAGCLNRRGDVITF